MKIRHLAATAACVVTTASAAVLSPVAAEAATHSTVAHKSEYCYGFTNPREYHTPNGQLRVTVYSTSKGHGHQVCWQASPALFSAKDFRVTLDRGHTSHSWKLRKAKLIGGKLFLRKGGSAMLNIWVQDSYGKLNDQNNGMSVDLP